jgi:hypothetical protein
MINNVNSNCITMTTDKIINCKENKCSISFLNENKKKIDKILVDNCAITTGLRCDYMLLVDKTIEHYIELKGTDINHAFSQLKRSIHILSLNPKLAQKHSYIIAIRIPLTTTSIQFQKAVFKKLYNSTLTLKSRHFSVTL